MAESKKKRSLREAFGVVRPPEEARAAEQTPEGTSGAGPAAAPEGGKLAPAVQEKTAKPASRKRRTSPNGSNSSSGTGTRRDATKYGTGDPVITGSQSGTRSGGRGRAASKNEDQEEAGEVVPGKGGKMVPAETPVNMTFTVTAKERYLWTLELKRRGLTELLHHGTSATLLAEGFAHLAALAFAVPFPAFR